MEQTDVNAPKTTVWEALAFSAALRLPPSVGAQQRADFVEQVCKPCSLPQAIACCRTMECPDCLLFGVPWGNGLIARVQATGRVEFRRFQGFKVSKVLGLRRCCTWWS